MDNVDFGLHMDYKSFENGSVKFRTEEYLMICIKLLENGNSIFMNRIKFITALLSVMLLYSSCGEDKINGKYTIFVDGGVKKLNGGNIITERTSVYPNVVDIDHNKEFILVKQLPNKKYYNWNLSSEIYCIYRSYSDFLNDSSASKKWHGLASDSSIYKIFASKGASTENTSADLSISHYLADSLIENDPYYKRIFASGFNYWIIYCPTDTLIGPLTIEEYEAKRKELKIPDDLQIE